MENETGSSFQGITGGKKLTVVTETKELPTISLRRRIMDKLVTGLVLVAVSVAVIALAFILLDTVLKGAPVISLSFLTGINVPPDFPGGGIGPEIEGTFIMVGIASCISVPLGVGAGIFYSEWPESRLSSVSSFTNDVLAEFPSMVIGIFVYLIVVLYAPIGFSALAGALALAIIMTPIVARTTEESLKIVPTTLREASVALGVSRSRTVLRVVISTGKRGLATGILLAVARAAGETAPLILTALGAATFLRGLTNEPTGALPLLIWRYGISPYPSWQADAWGAALVLIGIMLALNLTVKLLIARGFGNIRAEI
jgi:phosphate transport system permease protein